MKQIQAVESKAQLCRWDGGPVLWGRVAHLPSDPECLRGAYAVMDPSPHSSGY